MDHILLRQIRLTLGLNQSQFGELLGISRTYISMLETGRRNINDDITDRVKKEVDRDLIKHVDDLVNMRFTLEK